MQKDGEDRMGHGIEVTAMRWRGARWGVILLAAVWTLAADAPQTPQKKVERERVTARNISLSPPARKGKISLEEALWKRRSVRQFLRRELALPQASQLMWAAQGINRRTEGEAGLRTAPSAGQTYPLEVYLAVQDGLFHYLPQQHELEWLERTDLREALSKAASAQQSIVEAAGVIVLTAVPNRMESKFGEQTARYVYLEAGHVAQNIQLQTVAMDMGSVCIAAFDEAKVRELLELPEGEWPVYLIPVGWPQTAR